MAKKVLRNRVQFTTTIDPNLLDKIRKLSETTDIPISKLTDRAFEILLNNIENPHIFKQIHNKDKHE